MMRTSTSNTARSIFSGTYLVPKSPVDYVARRFMDDKSFDALFQKDLGQKIDLNSIQPGGPKGGFWNLKRRLLHVEYLLRQDNDLTTEEVLALTRAILTQGSFRQEYTALVGAA